MRDAMKTATKDATSPNDHDDEPVHIDDTAPLRTRDLGDLMHAAIAALLTVGALLISLYLRGVTSGVEYDAHTAVHALDWLMALPASVLQQLATVVIVLSVLIHMLIGREWLQSGISVIALFGGYLAIRALSLGLTHIAGLDFIAALDSVGVSPDSGLLPDIYAGVGAFLTLAGPRRSRTPVKWGWNTLYTVAVVLIIVSWHSIAGVLASFAVGRVVGMLLRFAVGTQNKGTWGRDIVQCLHGIGLDLTTLARRPATSSETGILQTSFDDDLIENSRLYDGTDGTGRRYTISVLDNQTHTAGYINQLWQWIRLSGVSMRRDRSAAAANHHHLAMLLGLRHIGLATLGTYGVADSEESSLLVFTHEDEAEPCAPEELSDDDIAGLLTFLETANRRGYTHRRITPDTIGRMGDGTMAIIGWHNGDCASGSANAALDKAQLLALLTASCGLARTIAAARRTWSDAQLIALAPFVQKVAVPAATRALPGWDKDTLGSLRGVLKALAPEDAEEDMEPVVLSRFNLRSFVALVLTIVALIVIVIQLRPDDIIDAVRHATLWTAAMCFLFSLLAWVGAATTLGAFMERSKRRYFALFNSQAASGLTAVSMPAGVGPAFVNLQFLRKNGYHGTAATAIMTAAWLIQAITTVFLLLVIGVFTGRNTLSGMIPANTLIVSIGVVALAISSAMVIPPIRRLVVDRYWPIVKAYARQLLEIMSQPAKMTGGILGALILNISTGMGFWAALLAFGYHTNPIETLFIFLLANTLGSAVPTPGGIGAVEAALTFSFTSVGVPAAVALSATLLYRVCFYWIRIPIGALSMKWLDRHNLV